MTTPTTEVITVVGGYRVTLKGRVHLIDKQRSCSCGRKNCSAIASVTAYLRAGGQRAPEASVPQPSTLVCCPICQAPAHGSIAARDWMCTVDRQHYFVWRVERLRKARDHVLQSADSYTREVLAAFASSEVRTAFVATHALTYAAGA